MRRWGTTQADPTSYEPVTVIRPSRLRTVLVTLGPVILPMAAVVVLAFWATASGSWGWGSMRSVRFIAATFLAGAAIATGALFGPKGHRVEVAFTSFTVHDVVYVRESMLSKGRWKAVQTTISFDDLDHQRSARRTLLERVLGWHRLYTLQGLTVRLRRRAFNPADFQRLLGRLNIRE